MSRNMMLVVCALALTLCTASAWASTTPPADTLKVDYFANANTAGAPDGTVRLTNPGTAGGNLCAAVFVFDQNQEMSECCSCFLSPDGLRTLSVNTDITGNPLTGVILNTGSDQDCFDRYDGRNLPASHQIHASRRSSRLDHTHPKRQLRSDRDGITRRYSQFNRSWSPAG